MGKIRRIVSVAVAILCCWVYLQTDVDNKTVLVSSVDRDYLGITLLYEEMYLVPVYLEVPFLLDEKEAILLGIEYMQEGKEYGKLTAFLNEGAGLNSVLLEDDIAYIDVNSSFFKANSRENRRIAEALVSVIRMNTSAREIILSEDGMLLGNLPYTQIPIKNLVYSLPMNVFEAQTPIHQAIPVTVYKEIGNDKQRLLMPVTKYMAGEQGVEFIMNLYVKELLKMGLFTEFSSPLLSHSMENGALKLKLDASLCLVDRTIEEHSLVLLLLMLFDNLHVQSIELFIEDEVYLYRGQYSVIYRKDLVYNVLKI